MNKSVKYNILVQNYIGNYLSIPFINSKYDEDNVYNIFVKIINTDYFNTFIRTFETNN